MADLAHFNDCSNLFYDAKKVVAADLIKPAVGNFIDRRCF